MKSEIELNKEYITYADNLKSGMSGLSGGPLCPVCNSWLNKLTDVETKRILIDKGDWQKDFSIVVTPTIIIFVDGEEKKRYQANIMMTMEATREEVQEKIDEIIMEDF